MEFRKDVLNIDSEAEIERICAFIREQVKTMRREGVVIGISGDSVESHKAFSEKLSLPFSILSDEDMTVINAYGAYGEKNMYGKRIEGILRTTFVLDEEGTVIRVFKRPKSAIHAEEVLLALKQHRS